MITLFKPDETNFKTNGIGILDNNIIDPLINEELNGIYTMKFTYPIFAKYGNEITGESVVRAPVPKGNDQLFRVYKISPSMGYIDVTLRHIFYDLIDNFIEDTNIVQKNGINALNQLLGATQYGHRFEGFSDIQKITNSRMVRANPVEAILDTERDNSFINRWGGEIRRDNFEIYMFKQVGNDDGYTIRHRKNLVGYEADIDWSGVTTRIMPYGFDGLMLPEKYVDSQKISNYVTPKIQKIEYNDIKAIDLDADNQDENAVPLEEAYTLLRNVARNEYERNNIDIPIANYKVDFLMLEKIEEYKDLLILQEVGIGDYVTVNHEDDGINIKARVISYEWNPLSKEYTKMELGNFFGSLTQTYNDLRAKIDSNYQNTLDRVEIIQTSANGKNKIFRGIVEPTAGMKENDLWYKPVGQGETELYNYNGTMWKLEKVSAGLLGGNLDATNGDVNLINVNVATLVGEISSFVQSYWNAINSQVLIDGNGVQAVSSTGDRAIMTSAGEFRSDNDFAANLYALMGGGRFQAWGDRGSAFQLGADLKNNTRYDFDGGLGVSYNNNFSIGRYDDWSANVTTDGRGGSLIPYLSIMYNGDFNAQNDRGLGEPNGYIRVHKPVTMEKSIYMAGNNISQPYEINFLYGGRIYALSSTSDLRIQSANNISLRTGGDVEKMRIDSTRVYFYQDINMQGNGILEQSDERLKGNFVDASTRDSLGKFKRLNFTYFEWLNESKKRPQGTQFGVKAQEVMEIAPEWVELDPDGYYTINISKMQMESFKAIQQLESENENLKNEVSEINSELRELKELLKEKGVI